MTANRDVQIQVKKIPAFTVLKNGSILKNIFLLRNPPPFSSQESAVNKSSRTHESNEEILLVGRHPNCNIILEHPSISRFHLRIHSNPSSHMLSVIDLSSVHGTWVSGKRIKPGVHVKLKEGDTVRMGGSSRIYELHWVPLSRAYDVDNPFIPSVYISKVGEEQANQDEECLFAPAKYMSKEGEAETNQDENCPCLDKFETQLLDDDLESSNLSCSNKIQHPSLKKLNPLTSSVPNNLNFSCDDAAVEHFSSKTGNENGEIFSTVLVQVPLIVSGTEDSDGLHESENQSNWSTDNMSDESEQLNHGTMKDNPVSVALSDATNNEKEALNQQKIENDSVPVTHFNGVIRDEHGAFTPDRAGGKEADKDDEFEQMNPTKIKIEPASVVLFDDGVDNCVNESVFLDFPDELEDQEPNLIQDISRTKEVHMNLFDGLDENEWEIFTPDKENKNPNSCSVKSMKKKAVSPNIFSFSKTLFTNKDESHNVSTPDEEKVDSFINCEVLCSSENEPKSRLMKMEGNCNSFKYPQTIRKVIDSSHNFPGGPKKRWTMIVDTNSLLHNESLKHLKILQGLKGTQLFVPRIVMKELIDIKGQHNLSKKGIKDVSLALKWIEECIINTRWWIHVDEQTQGLEVLETALHLRRTTTHRQIIILSNNLTLKIKAMADGVMCEKAEEFRRSLVNPFSERFMWVGSVARGLTWSCVDDVVLRQKYGECSIITTHGLSVLTHAMNF